MNQFITARRLIFALVVILIALLIPTFIAAQTTHPPIPHPVEGFEDCLSCHETGTSGAPQIPDNHTGVKGDVCTVCHKSAVQAEAAPGFTLQIPHAVTGYENCTDC